MSELAADGIPVAVSLRVLKLSRQSYYRWRKQQVAPAERVVDAVRERGLADRTQRIAQDLARTGPVLRSRTDAEALAPGELATRIACGEHGDARVAEIVEILIGGSEYMPGPALEAFARRAVGSSSVSTRHLIEAAFAEEPRGSDVMVYVLGIVPWELAKGAESARATRMSEQMGDGTEVSRRGPPLSNRSLRPPDPGLRGLPHLVLFA
ncbi:hypothetical protein GCM10028787_26750 [Brachybacterium horti]